jgi:hypothetical protein
MTTLTKTAQFSSYTTLTDLTTHSWFGAEATNSRCTRSRGRSAASAGIVVLAFLPRVAPAIPRPRISRCTVHRATGTSSRASWRHTLRTP